MSATVRTFFHTGLTTAPVAAGTRYTTDSVALLKQPYAGRSAVTVDSGAALSTTAAPSGTKIAHVQVEPGKSVHYEIVPPSRTATADTSSPILSGNTQFEFGPEWTISFLEATAS
jgi:hypothetical protein